MDDYIRPHPDADFVFASFASLGPDVLQIHPDHHPEMIARFAALHDRRPFCGVLNRKEKCVIPAATLANALGLRPILSDPALARDKFRMRIALNAGLAFPRCRLIASEPDADIVPHDMFPCVLKPRFGFNSRSVCLAPTRAALRHLIAFQQGRYRQLPKQDGTNSDFLVEELVTGTEHTIETLLKDGQPLLHLFSDKHPMTPPFFIEVGDLMPSAEPAAVKAQLSTAAAEAARRLGILNGWTHTEIRLHQEEPVVIECAARMGGGYFEQLIETVYGIDRMRTLIDLHLDRPLPTRPEPRCHVAARRFVLDGINEVSEFENGDELFSQAGLTLVWPDTLDEIPRTVVGPPYDFNNTVFEFFARADSAPSAARIADDVMRRARVRRRRLPQATPSHSPLWREHSPQDSS